LQLKEWQFHEIVTFLARCKAAILVLDAIEHAVFKGTSIREHTLYTIGRMTAHLEKYLSQELKRHDLPTY
jgi:hypothetical protein